VHDAEIIEHERTGLLFEPGNVDQLAELMLQAWANPHAKRYFSEAVQLNPKDPVVTPIMARIDELFAIDAEARCQRLSLEVRHALRQEQSRPLRDEIRRHIEAARSTALPGAALAKACN
jgi:Transposase IS66 family